MADYRLDQSLIRGMEKSLKYLLSYLTYRMHTAETAAELNAYSRLYEDVLKDPDQYKIAVLTDISAADLQNMLAKEGIHIKTEYDIEGMAGPARDDIVLFDTKDEAAILSFMDEYVRRHDAARDNLLYEEREFGFYNERKDEFIPYTDGYGNYIDRNGDFVKSDICPDSLAEEMENGLRSRRFQDGALWTMNPDGTLSDTFGDIYSRVTKDGMRYDPEAGKFAPTAEAAEFYAAHHERYSGEERVFTRTEYGNMQDAEGRIVEVRNDYGDVIHEDGTVTFNSEYYGHEEERLQILIANGKDTGKTYTLDKDGNFTDGRQTVYNRDEHGGFVRNWEYIQSAPQRERVELAQDYRMSTSGFTSGNGEHTISLQNEYGDYFDKKGNLVLNPAFKGNEDARADLLFDQFADMKSGVLYQLTENGNFIVKGTERDYNGRYPEGTVIQNYRNGAMIDENTGIRTVSDVYRQATLEGELQYVRVPGGYRSTDGHDFITSFNAYGDRYDPVTQEVVLNPKLTGHEEQRIAKVLRQEQDVHSDSTYILTDYGNLRDTKTGDVIHVCGPQGERYSEKDGSRITSFVFVRDTLFKTLGIREDEQDQEKDEQDEEMVRDGFDEEDQEPEEEEEEKDEEEQEGELEEEEEEEETEFYDLDEEEEEEKRRKSEEIQTEPEQTAEEQTEPESQEAPAEETQAEAGSDGGVGTEVPGEELAGAAGTAGAAIAGSEAVEAAEAGKTGETKAEAKQAEAESASEQESARSEEIKASDPNKEEKSAEPSGNGAKAEAEAPRPEEGKPEESRIAEGAKAPEPGMSEGEQAPAPAERPAEQTAVGSLETTTYAEKPTEGAGGSPVFDGSGNAPSIDAAKTEVQGTQAETSTPETSVYGSNASEYQPTGSDGVVFTGAQVPYEATSQPEAAFKAETSESQNAPVSQGAGYQEHASSEPFGFQGSGQTAQETGAGAGESSYDSYQPHEGGTGFTPGSGAGTPSPESQNFAGYRTEQSPGYGGGAAEETHRVGTMEANEEAMRAGQNIGAGTTYGRSSEAEQNAFGGTPTYGSTSGHGVSGEASAPSSHHPGGSDGTPSMPSHDSFGHGNILHDAAVIAGGAAVTGAALGAGATVNAAGAAFAGAAGAAEAAGSIPAGPSVPIGPSIPAGPSAPTGPGGATSHEPQSSYTGYHAEQPSGHQTFGSGNHGAEESHRVGTMQANEEAMRAGKNAGLSESFGGPAGGTASPSGMPSPSMPRSSHATGVGTSFGGAPESFSPGAKHDTQAAKPLGEGYIYNPPGTPGHGSDSGKTPSSPASGYSQHQGPSPSGQTSSPSAMSGSPAAQGSVPQGTVHSTEAMNREALRQTGAERPGTAPAGHGSGASGAQPGAGQFSSSHGAGTSQAGSHSGTSQPGSHGGASRPGSGPAPAGTAGAAGAASFGGTVMDGYKTFGGGAADFGRKTEDANKPEPLSKKYMHDPDNMPKKAGESGGSSGGSTSGHGSQPGGAPKNTQGGADSIKNTADANLAALGETGHKPSSVPGQSGAGSPGGTGSRPGTTGSAGSRPVTTGGVGSRPGNTDGAGSRLGAGSGPSSPAGGFGIRPAGTGAGTGHVGGNSAKVSSGPAAPGHGGTGAGKSGGAAEAAAGGSTSGMTKVYGFDAAKVGASFRANALREGFGKPGTESGGGSKDVMADYKPKPGVGYDPKRSSAYFDENGGVLAGRSYSRVRNTETAGTVKNSAGVVQNTAGAKLPGGGDSGKGSKVKAGGIVMSKLKSAGKAAGGVALAGAGAISMSGHAFAQAARNGADAFIRNNYTKPGTEMSPFEVSGRKSGVNNTAGSPFEVGGRGADSRTGGVRFRFLKKGEGKAGGARFGAKSDLGGAVVDPTKRPGFNVLEPPKMPGKPSTFGLQSAAGELYTGLIYGAFTQQDPTLRSVMQLRPVIGGMRALSGIQVSKGVNGMMLESMQRIVSSDAKFLNSLNAVLKANGYEGFKAGSVFDASALKRYQNALYKIAKDNNLLEKSGGGWVLKKQFRKGALGLNGLSSTNVLDNNKFREHLNKTLIGMNAKSGITGGLRGIRSGIVMFAMNQADDRTSEAVQQGLRKARASYNTLKGIRNARQSFLLNKADKFKAIYDAGAKQGGAAIRLRKFEEANLDKLKYRPGQKGKLKEMQKMWDWKKEKDPRAVAKYKQLREQAKLEQKIMRHPRRYDRLQGKAAKIRNRRVFWEGLGDKFKEKTGIKWVDNKVNNLKKTVKNTAVNAVKRTRVYSAVSNSKAAKAIKTVSQVLTRSSRTIAVKLAEMSSAFVGAIMHFMLIYMIVVAVFCFLALLFGLPVLGTMSAERSDGEFSLKNVLEGLLG